MPGNSTGASTVGVARPWTTDETIAAATLSAAVLAMLLVAHCGRTPEHRCTRCAVSMRRSRGCRSTYRASVCETEPPASSAGIAIKNINDPLPPVSFAHDALVRRSMHALNLDVLKGVASTCVDVS